MSVEQIADQALASMVTPEAREQLAALMAKAQTQTVVAFAVIDERCNIVGYEDRTAELYAARPL